MQKGTGDVKSIVDAILDREAWAHPIAAIVTQLASKKRSAGRPPGLSSDKDLGEKCLHLVEGFLVEDRLMFGGIPFSAVMHFAGIHTILPLDWPLLKTLCSSPPVECRLRGPHLAAALFERRYALGPSQGKSYLLFRKPCFRFMVSVLHSVQDARKILSTGRGLA